jgi:thioredoxin 1
MAGSKLIHLTDENFDHGVAEGVVLVDLWSPSCAPCLVQAPILEKVADAVGETAKIAKLNVEEGAATAARFGVRAIPTLILLKEGKELGRFVGLQQEQTLVSAIEDAVGA